MSLLFSVGHSRGGYHEVANGWGEYLPPAPKRASDRVQPFAVSALSKARSEGSGDGEVVLSEESTQRAVRERCGTLSGPTIGSYTDVERAKTVRAVQVVSDSEEGRC